ncbi:MAG TPA: LCP family protein [Anaerolineae bacterium]|nr:LCP family protein [Anaerolineae bacterium]
MTSKRAACVLLLLAAGLALLAGLAKPPAPDETALASGTPAATAVPSASPSSTARPPARPATPDPTPTETSRPTATAAPTLTFTPWPTLTSAPATAARTAAPSLVPTQTLSPTLAPTLTPTPAFSPTPLPTAVATGDWLSILLIGLDSTDNLEVQNTDVIIVALVNKDTKQVSLLSVPRDLWVYIPRHGWSRVNTAHKLGYQDGYPGEGPALLRDTLAINLGIVADHWARVDFKGFTKVIDELGGIDITVTCPVNLDYRADDPGGDQILEPGLHHMDGATALRYVRTRRGVSDFARAGRQQQLLRALWAQRKNVGLDNVLDLFSALTKSIDTDLGLREIPPLASVAAALEPQHIRSRYIGRAQTRDWVTDKGWQVLLPRVDMIRAVVASLYAPPAASEDQAVGEGAVIEILNGTDRAYLAQVALDELRWHGLAAVSGGQADRTDYAETQLILFEDKPKAVALLAQVFQIKPQNVILQIDPNQPIDLRVILGGSYNPCE